MSKIADLNDQFRRTFEGGRVLMTAGVAALPEDVQREIVKSVREFSDFTEDNDPHGDHDFGGFKLLGQDYFWKIDYYDVDAVYGSEDPADPKVTTRVLTIMLAEDY